jgi:hypothetical protein
MEIMKMKTRSIVVSIIFSLISLSSAFAQWSSDPLVNTQITSGGGVSFAGTLIQVTAGPTTTPVIASDGKGGAIFIYAMLDSSTPFGSIYAQRIDASGIPMWGTKGVSLTQNGLRYRAYMISDGAGGAFVTWSEEDSSYTNPDSLLGLFRSADVYAQRIDASGNTRWNQKGVPVCTGNSGQNTLDITSDGADGVFITCNDNRINHGGGR